MPRIADMSLQALNRAVQVAGSQMALARALGIKSPSISCWYKAGRVPAERCLAIEAATGVSRHDLRPDVFGPAPANDGQADPGGEVSRAA